MATASGICVFVAVFLGCTSTGRVGLCFLWFYVQEIPKAQPAVVLVLKRLRGRGNGLVSSDRLGEAGNRTFGFQVERGLNLMQILK